MFHKVTESQTLLINNQSKDMELKNLKVIKFGFGQSPFLPPSFVIEELKNFANRKEYSSVQGDLKLRENVANFHYKFNKLEINPENIFIAPGSKILLYNIMKSFIDADVLIPAPAWVSYAPQAKLIGHHVITLKTSFEKRWRIDSHIITEAIKNKKNNATILILNYPGNPDGLTYNQIELEEITKVARKHDIYIISDEIYGFLNHNKTHDSIAKYYPEKTITTTGISKWCGAGGWRLGIAILSKDVCKDFKKAFTGIGSETYSCAPIPVQMATKLAYGEFDKSMNYLNWQIEILKEIGNYCFKELTTTNVKLHQPEGGFYLFPDFSNYSDKFHSNNIYTSTDMCEKLLNDTGVVLLPAAEFGFEKEYFAARLAYVDFENPKMNKDFNLQNNAPKVVEGIQLIKNWLKGL